MVTFTEADPFIARWPRIVQGGTEVYPATRVLSTSLSFPLPYSVANGVPYDFYLSTENSYGLRSAEDHEAFTPVYTGPAAPTITVTSIPSRGCNLCYIANSDTPTYNELWRYVKTEGIATAIRIATNLPKNISFADYNVISALTYTYFPRAYNSVLFTDGNTSGNVQLILENAFLHAVSRDSVSSTAQAALELLNTSGQWTRDEVSVSTKLIGRAAPSMILGQPQWQRASVNVIIQSYADVNSLLSIWQAQKAGAVLCYRDQIGGIVTSGNRVFGKMSQPQVVDMSTYLAVSFEMIETSYVEAV